MIIKIPLLCRSKKNSQQILFNSRTNKPFISQSSLYKQFESECGYYLMNYKYGIDYPINLKCTFYVPDKRKRDIVNLLNAIQDILVKYGVIADDSYDIVSSLNGSKIIYEKNREEIIIEIEDIDKIAIDDMTENEMFTAIGGIDDAMKLIESIDIYTYEGARRKDNQNRINIAYDKLFKTKKYIERRIGGNA